MVEGTNMVKGFNTRVPCTHERNLSFHAYKVQSANTSNASDERSDLLNHAVFSSFQNEHNPDACSKSGFTPLHIAAHYGNVAVAKALLSAGADAGRAAKHNITPLHVASKWGQLAMLDLLVEHGKTNCLMKHKLASEVSL